MDDATKAQLADVYEKAAEYLEEYGWTQGRAGEHKEPRCLIGATYSATGGIGGNDKLGRQASVFAANALGLEWEWELPTWNDDPSRTKDEVINTLHALANKLR